MVYNGRSVIPEIHCNYLDHIWFQIKQQIIKEFSRDIFYLCDNHISLKTANEVLLNQNYFSSYKN